MNFEEFKNQLRNCRDCEHFGIKPKHFERKEKSEKSAKIVQISQEPSRGASESGKPFLDRSGPTLIKWYDISRESFLDPKLFYITGMAHCYSPDKKVRTKLQQTCSKKWLRQELSFLNPHLYIIIGERAANFLFPRRNFTELVFQKLVFKNRTAFVLPHPSPANKKWFKENPRFESDRLNDIRKVVHEAIQPNENV